MTMPERRTQVIVLKKTKLGESDLILDMMDASGSAVHGISKGARKPKNASSAMLEVLNCAEVSLAGGRSLDIVREPRLLKRFDNPTSDPAVFAAGSVMAEAARAAIQPDLVVERLFDMTRKALGCLSGATEERLVLSVCAYLFKLSALIGLCPSFGTCASCGEVLLEGDGRIRFSYADGGAVCHDCSAAVDSTGIAATTLSLCHRLLYSTFDEVASVEGDGLEWDVAAIAQKWVMVQTGCRMRSFSAFKALCGCTQAAAAL